MTSVINRKNTDKNFIEINNIKYKLTNSKNLIEVGIPNVEFETKRKSGRGVIGKIVTFVNLVENKHLNGMKGIIRGMRHNINGSSYLKAYSGRSCRVNVEIIGNENPPKVAETPVMKIANKSNGKFNANVDDSADAAKNKSQGLKKRCKTY